MRTDSGYTTRCHTPVSFTERSDDTTLNTQDRQKLITSLEGQRASIPSLRPLFEGWEYAVHPHVDAINVQIDQWLEHSVDLPTEVRRKYREKADFAVVAAAFYPHSTVDKLVTIAKYMYWIFFWDDEIDAGGALAEDTEGTLEVCAETKVCIEACLGPELCAEKPKPPAGSRPTVAILYGPLLEMRAGMATDSVERLRKDMTEWIESVEQAQISRISESLPTPDEHLTSRLANIAIKPSLTQSEYTMSYTMPTDLHEHQSVQQAGHLATNLCALINELHSLQKDARDGQLDNLVLLLAHHEGITIQQAIDRVVDMTKEARKGFDGVEKSLVEGGVENDAEVMQYVRCAKSVVTGTDSWEMHCGRYFGSEQICEDGSAVVELHFPSE